MKDIDLDFFIKNIADLLGHVNLDTTRIYAKTDMHNLQKVVAPFPSF